jgi:hypothetical protein
LDGAAIPGADDYFHEIQSSGKYDVEVTDANGCSVFATGADSAGGIQIFSISGKIASETGIAIPTCTVYLSGSEGDSMITANDGLYNFYVSEGGTYHITPSKRNDVVPNNGVSTFDIVLIQQHILAIQSLSSPYKIIAADVNASATVSTMDILLIRSVILAIKSSFPNDRLWEFASSDFVFDDPAEPFPFENTRTYNNISQSFADQNFYGIKLGDVNNSWDETIP